MAYAPVPVTNTSATNLQSQLWAYSLNRKSLDALRTKFQFLKPCMPDMIEKREGKTRTWFRYTNMPAATQQSPEGVVGTSLAIPPVKTVSAIAAQYADYVTISDIMRDTAPDSIMENVADQLGYRAGLTVDNVTRAVFDAESGASVTPLATYLSVRDFRAAGFTLSGQNVRRMDDGWFWCATHPYTAFDVVNDPSANGLADVWKYTDPSKAAGVKTEDRGELTTIADCRIIQSTNVLKTAGTPNKWRTYIVGAGAIGAVSLSGYEPSHVVDPNKETWKIRTKILNDIDAANPTGQIGALASYNFLHVAKILEGSSDIGGTYRFTYIDTPSSIVG